MATKKGEKVQEWTWEEISKHNTYDSCWIYVDDSVYDVTEWLPKHPGGDDMLLLFSGRDCSQCFRCYHPFSDKPFALLEKYKVGKLKGPSELVRWKPDSGFYKEASRRCADYFKQKKLDPLQNTWLYEIMRLGTSIAFFQFGFYLALKLMVDWGLPFYLRALVTLPLGCSGFMIAINVGHMCSHMPFLHIPKINYFLGWFSWDCCLGLSYDVWLHEHVVGHHQYTNIITIDPNCPESYGEDSMYRGSWDQKWYKHYTYQVLWLPLVSFLLVLENRLACFRYWGKGLRKDVRVNAHFMGTSSKILFAIGKLFFLIRMYIWPWMSWNAPWYEIVFMVQVTEMVAGYVVGTIFPANHITSEAVWPMIRTDEKGQRWIDAEWAVMQMEATKDYSFDNKLLSFMFGNLNNHTAHHMFPGMHHGHYQNIAPIIRQAAREHKIKIHSTETFAEFLYLYFRHLWNMGYETQKDI